MGHKLPDSGESGWHDKHWWNSLENYLELHWKHLTEHTFVEDPIKSYIDVISIPLEEEEILCLEGEIFCKHGVVLEVEKYAEVTKRRGRQRVRTFLYRYNAVISGKWNVLRYDNLHEDSDEYHRHVFDLESGEQIGDTQILSRHEFPVMHEILNELEEMFKVRNIQNA